MIDCEQCSGQDFDIVGKTRNGVTDYRMVAIDDASKAAGCYARGDAKWGDTFTPYDTRGGG